MDELQGEFIQQRDAFWSRSPIGAESKAWVPVYPTGNSGCMELRTSVRLPDKRSTSWVSFMIKLLRAYGGCLGARRR